MRTKEKIMGGAVALLLAITFLPTQEAWAGERWDKLSIGAKSAVGNIIGAVSPNTGNYIKTTNFGVGQRIGGVIDRGGIGMTTRGIDAFRTGTFSGYVSESIGILKSNTVNKYAVLSKGIGYLMGDSRSPGMGGFFMGMTKTVKKIPATAELSVLRSSTTITKTPISNVSSNTSSNRPDLITLTNNLVNR